MADETDNERNFAQCFIEHYSPEKWISTRELHGDGAGATDGKRAAETATDFPHNGEFLRNSAVGFLGRCELLYYFFRSQDYGKLLALLLAIFAFFQKRLEAMANLTFQVRMDRPRAAIREILSAAKYIDGLGDRVENFLKEKYGAEDSHLDWLKLTAEFLAAKTCGPVVDVKSLFGTSSDTDALSGDALGGYMLNVLASRNFVKNPERQQLFAKLCMLQMDENGVRSAIDRIDGCSVPQSIRELNIFTTQTASARELRRLVVAAFLKEVQQESGVKFCFTIAPLIHIQRTDPVKMVKLFAEVLSTGGITVKNSPGASIFVPLNLRGGPGEKFNPDKRIVLHHALARTAADASRLIKPVNELPSDDPRKVVEELGNLMGLAGISPNGLTCALSFSTGVTAGEKSRGSWDCKLTLGTVFQSLDFRQALDKLSDMAANHRKQLQAEVAKDPSISSGKIDETDRLVLRIDALKQDFKLPDGGVTEHVLEALGCVGQFSMERTFQSAEEVFWHVLDAVAERISAGKPGRILVSGKGHSWTVGPQLSPEFSRTAHAIAESPARRKAEGDALLGKIKAGEKVLFINPNWEGCAGVGIGNFNGKLELYIDQIGGENIRLHPGRKEYDCFLKELRFWNEKV